MKPNTRRSRFTLPALARLACLVAASTLLAASAAAQPAVIGGPFTFEGNDYYLLDQSTWEEANEAAEAMVQVSRTVTPDPERADRYDSLYADWQRVNDALRPLDHLEEMTGHL